MNDMIQLPTVEQINLEHQLANSKANEAVQHATNCGLMLLQVKASLAHGEWLPWLNGEIETGRLQVGMRQVQRYTKLAANTTRESFLLEAPSIRAALELLSDKDPEAQQGTLIDVEAERQAREAAEAKAEAERQSRELFERRARESQAESNERRKAIRELESQIDLLKNRPAPEPEKVYPADYEQLKQTERDLRGDLAELKQQQRELVQQQVVAKIKEREQEIAALEHQAEQLKGTITSYQAHIARVHLPELEMQQQVKAVEDFMRACAGLAASLALFEHTPNPATASVWQKGIAAATDAAQAMRMHTDRRPELTVIHGDAA